MAFAVENDETTFIHEDESRKGDDEMAIFSGSFRAFQVLYTEERQQHVAALPYDVVIAKRQQRLEIKNPDSFLHVDRAEMDLPDDTDLYDAKVYERARQNLQNMEKNGVMKQDDNTVLLYL